MTIKQLASYAAIGVLGIVSGRCTAPVSGPCPPCESQICEQAAEIAHSTEAAPTCKAVAPCTAKARVEYRDGMPYVELDARAEPSAEATAPVKTQEVVRVVNETRYVPGPERVTTMRPDWLFSVGAGRSGDRLFDAPAPDWVNAQISVSRRIAGPVYAGASVDTSGAVFVTIGGAL